MHLNYRYKSMKRLFFIISLLSITNADLIQPTNYNALYHTYVQFEWEQIPSTNRYQLMVSNNDLVKLQWADFGPYGPAHTTEIWC